MVAAAAAGQESKDTPAVLVRTHWTRSCRASTTACRAKTRSCSSSLVVSYSAGATAAKRRKIGANSALFSSKFKSFASPAARDSSRASRSCCCRPGGRRPRWPRPRLGRARGRNRSPGRRRGLARVYRGSDSEPSLRIENQSSWSVCSGLMPVSLEGRVLK